MRICATVLLGPGSESIVGDAIRSVSERVDGFVLVESGGGYTALAVAREAVGSTEHVSAHMDWTGSYSDARNTALSLAERLEYDYAVTLDPDERLELDEDYRDMLTKHSEVPAWVLPDRDTGYCKERVLKCGAGLKWHGRVSENVDTGTMGKLTGSFWELPKSPDADRRRWERGVVECQRMIDEGDDRFKWRRHLGSCLMGLGRPQEAVEQYRAALPLAKRAEDTAWVTYLICQQLVIDGDTAEARRLAAEGLANHAGFIPEFGWIFAYTDLKAGNSQNASRWAQLALNTPPDGTRLSFRSVDAKRGAREVLACVHGGHVRPVTDAERLMLAEQVAQHG